MSKNKLPSAITLFDGHLGLCALVLSLIAIKVFNFERPLNASLFVMGICSLVMIISTFLFSKVHLKPDYTFQFKKVQSVSIIAVIKSVLGLYIFYAFFLAIYLLIPEYQKDMYIPYGRLIYHLMPFLILLPIPYFYLLKTFEKKNIDVNPYENLIDWIFRKSSLDIKAFKLNLLSWILKCFYFPLMFVSLHEKMELFINHTNFNPTTMADAFYLLYHFIFTVDVVFVSIGYLFTFKIFHSHNRSVETSIWGWLVTIICYIPFWPLLDRWFFHYYSQGKPWWVWLEGHWAYTPWAITILLLLAIYSYSSVVFGLRFSNLTNRGIITHGPYRFFKHPAYISKCLAWLFISVPFVAFDNYPNPFLRTLALLLLWLIYYLRAKTEERHLSQDNSYLEYLNSFKLDH